MSILTIHCGNQTVQHVFTPPERLEDVLEVVGFSVSHPCGGHGNCGKCAVNITGEISDPTPTEAKMGYRLSCQTTLMGNAEVFLPKQTHMTQIQMTSSANTSIGIPMKGHIGAAVDIGTTTIALRRYNLHNGELLGQSAMENPQSTIAADVIGRIEAAMNGKSEVLRTQVLDAIGVLLKQAGGSADTMVIVGNTTMLYLLAGKDPTCLSKVPFEADCLFDTETTILGIPTYLPPCMDAFVGADISCTVLSSGICNDKTSLLCDIGTNGEIALWKGGTLYVTSTAAGPAFEGAGISCGCRSIPGAIDQVWIEQGAICTHTIADVSATGICGSGIIDAIAMALTLEMIDETGAIEDDIIPLTPTVSLCQKDIRMVQLSKAAIAAGIQTLMEISNTDYSQIENFYIAGGFGSHLNVHNAITIGLIPEALNRNVQVIGNAALAGASQLLLNTEDIPQIQKIVSCSKHYNLGGNPLFNNHYVDQMMF